MIFTIVFLGPLKFKSSGRVLDSRNSHEALLCALEENFILCLVLSQSRKTGYSPDITEKMLTGTHQHNLTKYEARYILHSFFYILYIFYK